MRLRADEDCPRGRESALLRSLIQVATPSARQKGVRARQMVERSARASQYVEERESMGPPTAHLILPVASGRDGQRDAVALKRGHVNRSTGASEIVKQPQEDGQE